ncbi:MAG TPA: diadenylate cyclase CdaA [Dehalococcoidia bacterium]|nr:diadenylate cyclase CdaA [Dehalococcoidia bacterium]
MTDALDTIRENFQDFDVTSAIDVLLISLLFFWVLLLLRGTTAMAVMRGVFILLTGAVILGQLFDLRVLNFLIRNSFTGLLIAIPIIFQPEIRRALERVGRTGARAFGATLQNPGTIDAVAEAAAEMAKRRNGALIVMERETGLQDYVDTGIPLDAVPSPELIENIFFPNAPMHDGALVIRGSRVVAASVTLPLSEDALPGELGTRHRAALGITERTDAVSVVVSEETGGISVAAEGRLHTRLDEARLRALLDRLLTERNGTS